MRRPRSLSLNTPSRSTTQTGVKHGDASPPSSAAPPLHSTTPRRLLQDHGHLVESPAAARHFSHCRLLLHDHKHHLLPSACAATARGRGGRGLARRGHGLRPSEARRRESHHLGTGPRSGVLCFSCQLRDDLPHFVTAAQLIKHGANSSDVCLEGHGRCRSGSTAFE